MIVMDKVVKCWGLTCVWRHFEDKLVTLIRLPDRVGRCADIRAHSAGLRHVHIERPLHSIGRQAESNIVRELEALNKIAIFVYSGKGVGDPTVWKYIPCTLKVITFIIFERFHCLICYMDLHHALLPASIGYRSHMGLLVESGPHIGYPDMDPISHKTYYGTYMW